MSELYTCILVLKFVPYSTMKINIFRLFFSKFRVLYSKVVRSSLVVNSDCKKMSEQISTPCIKIQYLHIVFRYSHPALLFNMTCGSSSRTRLKVKRKLYICAAIHSGVHYNALITKLPGSKPNSNTNKNRFCEHKKAPILLELPHWLR